jgi:biotin carboxylase
MTDKIVAIVDAYSTGRYFAPQFQAKGYRCVHVQSSPTIPAIYAPTYRPADFIDNIVHTGGAAATATAVARHRPVALIAGIESGVELADQLSERLGLRTNGTERSSARRNKFHMGETVKAAGLPTASQVLAADRDTLLDWYALEGAGRVVVKPVSSVGNDGIFFCDNEKEVLNAFDTLMDTDSALGLHNNAVLAQEYLLGVEYYVNTVSLDGVHYVTDLHSTRHLNINGVRDLLGGSCLLPRHGPEQDQLVAYTFGVLDALGVRNGPAHTEVKLTADGPRLVETASRICGGEMPVLVTEAIGDSQVECTVDAYVDPDRFTERVKQDYVIKRHGVWVDMISPRSGTLIGYPRMAELQALESYHDALLTVQPGEPITRSTTDFTYPMRVLLLHESPVVLQHDWETARYLDGEGFYDIA